MARPFPSCVVVFPNLICDLVCCFSTHSPKKKQLPDFGGILGPSGSPLSSSVTRRKVVGIRVCIHIQCSQLTLPLMVTIFSELNKHKMPMYPISCFILSFIPFTFCTVPSSIAHLLGSSPWGCGRGLPESSKCTLINIVREPRGWWSLPLVVLHLASKGDRRQDSKSSSEDRF